MHIIKVKAHCTAKSSQDPYLTYGNSMVDAAARAVARDAFRAKLEPYRKLITVAVSWQCHIIATLGERCACQFLCPSDQPPSDPTPSHLFPEQCNSEFLTKCENGTVRPNTSTDSGTFIKLFGILSPLSLFNPMSFLSWTSGMLGLGCRIILVSTSRLCLGTPRMSV